MLLFNAVQLGTLTWVSVGIWGSRGTGHLFLFPALNFFLPRRFQHGAAVVLVSFFLFPVKLCSLFAAWSSFPSLLSLKQSPFVCPSIRPTECPTFTQNRHWCWSLCSARSLSHCVSDRQQWRPAATLVYFKATSWQRRQEGTAGASSLLARQPLSPGLSAVGQSAWQMSTEGWLQCKINFFFSFSLFFLLPVHFLSVPAPSLLPLHPCLSLRWGSTSQTCMRTWEMDTTWFPCWKSSLESPW